MEYVKKKFYRVSHKVTSGTRELYCASCGSIDAPINYVQHPLDFSYHDRPMRRVYRLRAPVRRKPARRFATHLIP